MICELSSGFNIFILLATLYVLLTSFISYISHLLFYLIYSHSVYIIHIFILIPLCVYYPLILIACELSSKAINISVITFCELSSYLMKIYSYFITHIKMNWVQILILIHTFDYNPINLSYINHVLHIFIREKMWTQFIFSKKTLKKYIHNV